MKITDLQLNIQLSINIRKAHISKTNSYSQYITDAHEACHATMASLAHTHTHTHTHTTTQIHKEQAGRDSTQNYDDGSNHKQ